MMNYRYGIVWFFGAVSLAFCSPAYAQQDENGCKDHPLFTRMPGTHINECRSVEFEGGDWYDPDTQGSTQVRVEGKYYYIKYYNKKEHEGKRSNLQISRNYQNAMKKLGGSIYSQGEGRTYVKIVKDGKEIWAKIDVAMGDSIAVEIIEREAMKQEIVADAKFMSEGISSTGHVAVYGIHFDFNKSDIKPESEPALREIATLLAANPGLKVFVVGHSDNAGDVGVNMKLSQARADAVVDALATKHKVNPDQMKPYGVGQLAPVASNDNEGGRARNRRVDLVKQ